mmetsp:Transcript_17364/g.45043  ORF Transcript_17364/g.45043 Transcript_17364/m.45043 type:complete len:236 (-) Transcript_17364:935-1642(-)
MPTPQLWRYVRARVRNCSNPVKRRQPNLYNGICIRGGALATRGGHAPWLQATLGTSLQHVAKARQQRPEVPPLLLRALQSSPLRLLDCDQAQVVLLHEPPPKGHGAVEHGWCRTVVTLERSHHRQGGVDVDMDVRVRRCPLPQRRDVGQEADAGAVVGLHCALDQGFEDGCHIRQQMLRTPSGCLAILLVQLHQSLHLIRRDSDLAVHVLALSIQGQVALVYHTECVGANLRRLL